MVEIDEFSRLVAGIYAAAASPTYWEAAIREIHRTLGGTGGALLTADGPLWSIHTSTLPAGAASGYAEHYCRLDRPLAALRNGAVGAVRTGAELVRPYRRSEFYSDWLRPNEIEDGLFVRLDGGATPACFVVHAPRRSVALDTPERVKLFGNLAPHLQQALRTHGALTGWADRTRHLLAALDAAPHGVVVAGIDGSVLILNTAAEAVLRRKDGLRTNSGRIGATSAPADGRLRRALRDALTGGPGRVRRGSSFTCARPSGRRPYVIHVLPLHGPRDDTAPGRPSAMVLIKDPEHESAITATTLHQLYELTNSEAEVVLNLSRGATLKGIADELSVSYGTVRTHLQHAFDKTDTHRQAELVRLVSTMDP